MPVLETSSLSIGIIIRYEGSRVLNINKRDSVQGVFETTWTYMSTGPAIRKKKSVKAGSLDTQTASNHYIYGLSCNEICKIKSLT